MEHYNRSAPAGKLEEKLAKLGNMVKMVDRDSAANYFHTNSNHFLWSMYVDSPMICNCDPTLHPSPTISSDKLDRRQLNASLLHCYCGSFYFERLESMSFGFHPADYGVVSYG